MDEKKRETDPELKVVKVQMHDTGLGREAGYRDDAELIEAYERRRAEIEELVGPEVMAKFDEAEREFERRVIGG